MRVLLIRPNSNLKHIYVPIGLGYIADAARGAGHEVRMLDAQKEKLSVAEVIKRVEDVDPDVVGMTALHMYQEIQGVRDLGLELKKAGGRFPVVLGGPLVSTSGEEMVRAGVADIAVIGEGELTFNRILDTLDGAGTIEEIPGLIYSQDGEIKVNMPGPFLDNLDGRMPAWDLIVPSRYFSLTGMSGMSRIKRSHRSVPIFTSRGCPFGCIYCHNLFGKKFRPRSPESVLTEISLLKEQYGIKEIDIVDDCFNLDVTRAKEIMRMIIDRKLGLHITFPNGLRADRMDEELIDLLKEAGTYRIVYAVETGSPRLQKLISKNVDLERTQEIINYTAGKGIMTCGFFMMGFPTETEDEVRLTIDYAIRSMLHQAYFFYVNPFPGTPLAERYPVPEQDGPGIRKMEYFGLNVNLSELPDSTLQKLNKEAYRRFHFSPKRMWRTLRVVPKNIRIAWGVAIIVALSIRDLHDDF